MKPINELGVSPAPWKVNKALYTSEILSADGIVCDTIRSDENARLIASAPGLYEALAAVVSWYESNKPLPYEENGIDMICHYARIALAKAAGGEVAK